jgi:hypothetical protein
MEMARIKASKEEKTEAAKELKALLEKAGRKVYCKVTHVSRSGMYRLIDFYIITSEPIRINRRMAVALGRGIKKGSLECHGCGMDMGFEAVYALGQTLWPHGDGKTITGRNGDKQPETDGGYLLEHVWM